MQLTYPLPDLLYTEALAEEVSTAVGRTILWPDIGVLGDEVTIRLPDDLDPDVVTPLVAAVVAAHTGQPTPAQQADAAEEAEAQTVFGDFTPAQLAKIRDVYAGNGSFTVAQRDRLLAGLALLVHRRLR